MLALGAQEEARAQTRCHGRRRRVAGRGPESLRARLGLPLQQRAYRRVRLLRQGGFLEAAGNSARSSAVRPARRQIDVVHVFFLCRSVVVDKARDYKQGPASSNLLRASTSTRETTIDSGSSETRRRLAGDTGIQSVSCRRSSGVDLIGCSSIPEIETSPDTCMLSGTRTWPSSGSIRFGWLKAVDLGGLKSGAWRH